VNFEGKLQTIDNVLNQGCFNGAWELLNPKYSYLPVKQKLGTKIGYVDDVKEQEQLKNIKF
jgi:hypothetical protein